MKTFIGVLLLVIFIALCLGIYEGLQPSLPIVHTQEYYAHKTCDLAMKMYNKNPTKDNEDFARSVCDK